MSDTDAEIQLLSAQLNNISFEEEMAQPNREPIQTNNETNYQLIRLSLDSIPQYDGNAHTLNIFINNCEYFLNTFASNNVAQNECLLRSVLGKLTGRALILIGSRIELKTWEEIKSVLLLSFSDQRNIDCLIQDLLALKPKNESPYTFGMRCQDARSLIISKLNSMAMSNEEKLIRLKTYDDLALKTFLRGLSGQIQNNVRLRNPQNLETAMSLVIEEENFLYSTQRQNNLNTHSNFKPAQRITPSNYQIRQMQPHTRQNNFQNTPNFNYRPNFQQPIQTNQFNPQNNYNNFSRNNFTRPQYFQKPSNQSQITNQTNNSQRYFSNPQNSSRFNHQTNNYQRHYSYPQNSPRFNPPEPMDTSSTNSPIKPKQNWKSTELFHQSIEEPLYENHYIESQNYPENFEYDFNNYNVHQNNLVDEIPEHSTENATCTDNTSQENFQISQHSQNPT